MAKNASYLHLLILVSVLESMYVMLLEMWNKKHHIP